MTASAFKLGEWTVEPDLNRLVSASGQEIRLEPKLMDVLAYLCKRSGEVVSSDDIVSNVWSEYPVSDNPVYNAIARLRHLLGDDPKQPTYIQTIPSRGYVVIADVSAAPDSAVRSALPVSNTGMKLLVAGFFLLAFAAITLMIASQRDPDPPTHTLISAFPGSHASPSFSPDGAQIAFVNDEGGSQQIWALELATMQRRQITHHRNAAHRPRWSPPGDRILYELAGSIRSVAINGDDDRQLIAAGANPDWAPDGRRFLFERRGEIWLADADGSNQNRIEGIPTNDLSLLIQRRPVFSPDGESIAYFHAPTSPLGDWWVVPVGGGTPRQLTFDKARSGWATWSADGKYLVASTQRAGSKTLWQFPLAGGDPKPLLVGAGDDDTPAIWNDKLIYSSRQDRYTLCVTDFDSNETREVFSSANDVVMPRFSPDESEIAFFAMLESGDVQVLAVPTAGGQERFVTSDTGARNQIGEWSSDGSAMYFYRAEPSPAFMRNDARGGPGEIMADGWTWIKENGAQVHPTKPKIIYSRLDRGFASETIVRDLTDGSDTAFPVVLIGAKWSHGGDRIAGSQSAPQGEIVVCAESGTNCEGLGQHGWDPVWSGDDRHIFFWQRRGDDLEIFFVDVADKSVVRQGRIGPIAPLGSFYDVSAQGHVAWIRYDRGIGELWLTSLSGR